MAQDWQTFCKECIIEIEFTAPPQHNDMAKCKIITDCNCALAILFDARLTEMVQALLCRSQSHSNMSLKHDLELANEGHSQYALWR